MEMANSQRAKKYDRARFGGTLRKRFHRRRYSARRGRIRIRFRRQNQRNTRQQATYL